jgi:hypothetical protein
VHYSVELHTGEAGVDFAEDVTDDRAEDHESCDDDDGLGLFLWVRTT